MRPLASDSMKKKFEVTSDFTVSRVGDNAPRPLKKGLVFFAHEPLGDPVTLDLDNEEYFADAGSFRHTRGARKIALGGGNSPPAHCYWLIFLRTILV